MKSLASPLLALLVLLPVGALAAKDNEDLPNFHDVHPFLVRGGEPSEKGLQKLKDMGVTTIIDLRNPGEKKVAEKDIAGRLKMKYVAVPMSSKPPTKKQVDTIFKEIQKVQKSPESDKVFVHCAHGSDRTGCIIGLWRVSADGYSYDDAYAEMRKYYFTPKFTQLSGTVKKYADSAKTTASKPE